MQVDHAQEPRRAARDQIYLLARSHPASSGLCPTASSRDRGIHTRVYANQWGGGSPGVRWLEVGEAGVGVRANPIRGYSPHGKEVLGPESGDASTSRPFHRFSQLSSQVRRLIYSTTGVPRHPRSGARVVFVASYMHMDRPNLGFIGRPHPRLQSSATSRSIIHAQCFLGFILDDYKMPAHSIRSV